MKLHQPIIIALSVCGLMGCQKFNAKAVGSGSISASSTSPNGSGSQPTYVAGGGAGVAGSGAYSVPTAAAVVSRITNGLGGNVSAATGGFATSLKQVKTNLPQSTDPTKASGFDQVQLLVYGACSDLTKATSGSAKMLSVYNVDPTKSIAANQAALVAAGVKMLDMHTAGLASGSSASAGVNAALSTLVQGISNTSSNTSTIAFMSVCMAANTAGATMMGF